MLAISGGRVAVRADGPRGEPAERVGQVRPAGMGAAVAPILAASTLLEGARRQQALGEQSKRWAKVYDLGVEGGLAYVLRARPGIPVGQAVASGRPIGHDDLRRIVAGVLEGMRAYHDAYGSACGAIDPRRVLIPAKGSISGSSVVLTDPSPTTAPVSEDIAALGELIWRLVERPGARTPAYHPVPASKAWRRVGRSGERWRTFANELLDPRTRRRNELPTAESLQARLPTEPVDFGRPARWAAVIVVVAGLGWGGYTFWQNRSISAEQEAALRAPLAELCLNYDAVEGLRRTEWTSSGFDETVREIAARFGDEVVGPLRGDGDPFRPTQYFPQGRYGNVSAMELYGMIVPQRGGEGLALQGNISESEGRAIDGASERLRSALGAWMTWEPRVQAGIWASSARRRGWTAVADAVDDAIAPVLPDGVRLLPTVSSEADAPIASGGPGASEDGFGSEGAAWFPGTDGSPGGLGTDGLGGNGLGNDGLGGPGLGGNGLGPGVFNASAGELLPGPARVRGALWALATVDAVGRAEQSGEALGGLDGFGSASDLAQLAADRFPGAIAEIVSSGDLALGEARERAQEWTRAMASLREVLESDAYERVLLGGSSEAEAIFERALSGSAEQVPSEIDALVQLARSYETLTGSRDPRPLAQMDERTASIRAVLAELDALGPEAGAQAFRQELDDIAQVRERYEARPVIELYADDLADGGRALVARLDSVLDRSQVQLAALQTTIGEQVVELRAELGAGGWVQDTPAREAWTVFVESGQRLADERGAAETGRDRLRFRQSARGLRDVLEWTQGDDAQVLRPWVPDVPAWADEAVVEAAVAEAFEARRRQVAVVAGEMASGGQVPSLTDDRIAGVIDSATASALAWGERANDLLARAERARELLDAGVLPDERAQADAGSGQAAETPAELLAGFRDSGSGTPGAALAPVAAGLRDRVASASAMLEGGSLDEIEVVAADAGSDRPELDRPELGRPELTRAAWQRLRAGSVPGDRVVDAASAGQRLLAGLESWRASAGDGTEFGAGGRGVSARVDEAWGEAPAVWMALARAAGTPDQLRGVLAVREAFRVDDAALATSDPSLAWNVQVYELEGRLSALPDGDDEAARAAARGFTPSVPGSVGPGGREFAQAVREIANNNDPKVEFDKIGPAVLMSRSGGRVGWTFDPAQSDVGVGNEVPRRLVYQSTRARNPAIEFVLVADGSDGSPPVLMSRHEVSIQTLEVVVEEAGDDAFRRLTTRAGQAESQPEVPMAWVVEESRRGLSLNPIRGRAWIAGQGTGGAISAFPEGSAADDASRGHPVQQIEADIAMRVAQVLGCRLPTWDEHARAMARWTPDLVRDPGAAVNAGRARANLRDQAWLRQSEYAQTTRAANDREISKEFGPWVTGFEAGGDLRNSVVADRVDDGFVWFCEVEDELNRLSGPGFGSDAPMHLVGNVAEWVLTMPPEQARGFLVDPERALPDAGGLAGMMNGRVGVAGGSAMMAQVDLSRALPLEEDVSRARYGDVGFRLALVLDGRFRSIRSYLLAGIDRAYVLGGG